MVVINLMNRILIILIIKCVYCYTNSENLRTICPHLYPKIFKGSIPNGNLTAGVFNEIKEVKSLKNCVLKCCETDTCNVVFMSSEKCFHINCNSNELCLPTPGNNPETNKFTMVLVKPVDEEPWNEILGPINSPINNDQFDREKYNILSDTRRLENIYRDLVMDESTYNYDMSCTVGINSQCLANEICLKHPKSRTGTCTCITGYYRNSEGDCVPPILKDLKTVGLQNSLLTERILDVVNNKSQPVTRKHLNVNADNKEVKLPNNEVTLEAKVLPNDLNQDEKYQYEWTSLQQPEGSTAVKHQNEGQLHLSKLSEGLYTFKVSVSNSFAQGETFVNVTVLPPSRINKPPIIIITPSNQTIKQPNSAAVLDASSSTDDDGIISWHWELQQAPLGYQPQLKDSPTLQLNDLTKPGNYTFKLTVTDSDKATSSAVANVTVLKFTDYPPEANAGEDKIIYLPHNKIILNGNLSIDDHAITTWEWTKSSDDAQKAVDMQDTRTPYLQLSNLEEGMYTFKLKVTDSANQSSVAQVHVFVKPPTNKPPIANAGRNLTISLPQTWILLDASNSTDDNKIISFKWEQFEGPSTVQFLNSNQSKTNVTGLTKGNYIFKISVTDDNNNVASANTFVTVIQNINQKPKANAGGNFEIQLPKNMIIINGTKSKDDWAIVKWKWIRADNSIAVGNIAENSDNNPILMLTDVIPGKYIFNLTVYDEQGLSDTDTVTFIIKNDPKLFYLIEITINIDAKLLTQSQYNILINKLALLMIDNTKLQVRNLKSEYGTGKAKIIFYVETINGDAVNANDVVKHLRKKLKVDASLLNFSINNLQTFICQNNCSGHGICNEQTRKCECEAFWMTDLFKIYLYTDEDSDCSWNILYVVLGMLGILIILVGTIWTIIYLCINWCMKRNLTTKKPYKLIENTDDLPPFSNIRKNNHLSDSDTDSDVVFESRKNSSGRYTNDTRNGFKSRNGYSKIGRRIKT